MKAQIYKEKSNNQMESDHIVFKDSNGKELNFFLFSHEVVLEADGCRNFRFSKSDNKEVYDFLCEIGRQLKEANEQVKGDFFCDNKFTWYHLARSWDRPLDQEAGFVATMSDDAVEINFFPRKYPMFSFVNIKNNFFVSMGASDGMGQPYAAMSSVAESILSFCLDIIPFEHELNI